MIATLAVGLIAVAVMAALGVLADREHTRRTRRRAQREADRRGRERVAEFARLVAADQWPRGVVLYRAEERIALTVNRPEAFNILVSAS